MIERQAVGMPARPGALHAVYDPVGVQHGEAVQIWGIIGPGVGSGISGSL